MLNLKSLVLLCRWSAPLLALVLALICAGCDSGPAPLTAEMPLHLEDHLDAATIVGSEVPEDIPQAVEWRFDEPQPDWKPDYGYEFSQGLVTLMRTSDALRVILEEKHADSDGDICVNVYTDLPDWQLQDWAYVALEARAQPGMWEAGWKAGLGFNFTEPARAGVWQAWGITSPLIADGTEQTYLLSPDPVGGEFDGTWRQLFLEFCALAPSTIDLLSVKVIPKEATFALARVGVSMEALEGLSRRTLYTHAPGKLTYQVRIPDAGQLDVGLRVVRRDAPVTFRVTVTPGGGEAEMRLEETVAETAQWAQRRVDLSDLAGQTVSLALEADADRAGTVALWAAPTLSGARTTETPNIIFYIIDNGAADSMSVYGYNRRTTPNIERLAAEGAVFEYVYSNSSWTTAVHTVVSHVAAEQCARGHQERPQHGAGRGADPCAAPAPGWLPDRRIHLQSQRRPDERSRAWQRRVPRLRRRQQFHLIRRAAQKLLEMARGESLRALLGALPDHRRPQPEHSSATLCRPVCHP